MKLNSIGVVQWQKCLGGSSEDYTTSIEQTSDGGFIFGGYTLSSDGDLIGNHSSGDYWVVKLNNTGSVTWQRTFGGSGFDPAYSIKTTSDGGYIVAGNTASDDGDVIGNHGALNMSLSNLGVMEVSGTFPQLKLKQNGIQSGRLIGYGLDAELSAHKPGNTVDTRGNLLLQLDLSGNFGNEYAGNVGIKTESPINILQIGNAPGFSGNQFAIGNGTKGMSFFQNVTTSHWYSSTNFALIGTAGGLGKVGIGTATPSEKLQIAGCNVKIESGNLLINDGKILTPQTGLFSLLPLCFGYVDFKGTLLSGTANVRAERISTGHFNMHCTGIKPGSVMIATSSTTTSPYTTPLATANFLADGVARIKITNLYWLRDQDFNYNLEYDFYFIIYN